MADTKLFDAAEVHKLLKASNGKPLSFGFAIGKTPADHCMGLSKTLAPARIFKDAKKAANAMKGAEGTVTLDGRTLTFVCEKGGGAALQKAFEQYLKANAIRYDVVVSDPSQQATASATTAKAKEPDELDADDEPDDAEDGGEDEDDDDPKDKMFQAPYVRRLLRQSKKEPRFFAFGLGKTREEDLLALHRRRADRRLFALVRKANAARKGTWGTVQLEGKVVVFRCARKPVPGMKRLVRLFFRNLGLPPMQVQIMAADGTEVPDDGAETPEALAAAVAAAEDLEDIETASEEGGDAETDADAQAKPEAEAQAGGSDAQPAAADTAPLSAELKALMPALKRRAAADEAARKDLSTLFNAFKAAVAIPDLAEAEAVMARLRPYAEEPASAEAGQADGGTADAMRKRLDPMKKAVPVLAEAFPGRRTEIEGLASAVDRALSGGDETAAAAAMQLLEEVGSALWQERKALAEAREEASGRLDAVSDGVTAALEVFADDGGEITGHETLARTLAEFDHMEAALDEIADLEFVAGLADAEEDAAREMLLDRFADLWPGVKAAMAADTALADPVQAARTAFTAALDAGDLMGCHKALDALAEIAALSAGGPRRDDAPAPETAAAAAALNARFKTAAQQWGTARKQVRKDMDTLLAAIMRTEGDDPDADRIRGQANELIGAVLDQYDGSLEALLDEAANENDPARKQDYRQRALELVKRHAAFADQNFVMTNIGANDYVNLRTRETVVNALGAIENTLA